MHYRRLIKMAWALHATPVPRCLPAYTVSLIDIIVQVSIILPENGFIIIAGGKREF